MCSGVERLEWDGMQGFQRASFFLTQGLSGSPAMGARAVAHCMPCTPYCYATACVYVCVFTEMGYERYKFIVQVVVGEQRGEGVK